MSRRSPALFTVLLSAVVGCASTPTVAPLDVSPLRPGSSERIVADQVVLIIDTSNSISKRNQFPGEKALVQSFVAGMPEGRYEAGAIAFGGFRRQNHPVAPFDRRALSSYARGLGHLGEGTPLNRVLGEAGAALEGKSDHAAIVVISDGVPTDPVGRDLDPTVTLDAARELAKSYRGGLCIYTVQIGDDAAGAAFLRTLSDTTRCGSYSRASSLGNAAALTDFERVVFLGASPTMAVDQPDSDGDGVVDARDQCPGTPRGASVDNRGCWGIPWLHFATNSAEITPASKARLTKEVVPVIDANPSLRLRIDGHTDSRGSTEHNQALSERRAEAVRAFLVSQGIEPARLEGRGFGESKPIALNDTPENLQRNRRTEITVID